MTEGLNLQNAPRDVNALQSLNQGQLVRLAVQLHLLDTDDDDQAFKGMQPQQKAVQVYNALLALDATGGQQGLQMTAPPQAAPPQQPQYQAPTQAPAQMTQQYPPQQYAPPVAPPPQQMQPQMQQQPPYAGYTPPVPPGAQQQIQPPQQMAQQQAYVPPPQYQAPVAPPPQQAYPPPPQQTYQPAPQQAYPPPPQQMVAPQQPAPAQRQPQTGSDPGNQGANVASALTQVLNQVLGGQDLIGRSLNNVGKGVSGVAEVLRCVLQIQLILSEQAGLDVDDLVKVLKHQDPGAVDRLLTKLGVGVGEGK